MSIALFAWLVPVLVAAEFGAVAYRRRNRHPRFLFSAWAPSLYALMILGDLLLAAGLTTLFGSGQVMIDQRTGLLGWAIVAGLAAAVIALLTLFFRWIAHTEISDIPD